MNESKILIEFPLVGQIVRTTSRGFGFVKHGASEHFIHVSNHVGRRLASLEGMEWRYCAFVLGGDPKALSAGKEDWSRQAIRWTLLNAAFQATSEVTYAAARAEALGNVSNAEFCELLAADWYQENWIRARGSTPEANLQPDQILMGRVHTRLAESRDLGELILTLAAVCRSPWFQGRSIDSVKAYKQFFRPQDWPRCAFRQDRPLVEYEGYRSIELLCGADLAQWIRKARMVAIDLESDGQTIFEYGWSSLGETGRRQNLTGLAGQELQDAVDASLLYATTPCIVGHNLIAWDWPILRKSHARLPEHAELWDTLLGSWLLQPWSSSHALVVRKNAHRADADAAACYELFEHQIGSFASCLEGDSLDVRRLVDRLLEQPKLFGVIAGREYPATVHAQATGPTLFPACKKRSFAWQRDSFVQFLNPENRYWDPVLHPASCRVIADSQGSIEAKAIAAVVADATASGVAVHLSWIPGWLADDDLKEVLRKAHESLPEAQCPKASTPIYVAEDLFRLGEEEIESLVGEGHLSVVSPEHVAAAWQEARRQELRDDQIAARFPEARIGWQGRKLFAIEEGGLPAWLLHVPSGLGSAARCWQLLPKPREWMRLQPQASGDTRGFPIRIPRWRDGDAGRLDVDREFVSPDTANRRLYLRELTHAVLNVLKATPEGTVLLVGVQWSGEADTLQRSFSHLGLSSEHPGSPLRHLESLRKKRHSVLCCHVLRIPDYLEAGQRLDIEFDVLIDELPIHEWHAILRSPSRPVGNPRVELDDTENGNEVERSARHVLLRGADIRLALDTFLEGWLEGLGLTDSHRIQRCLILDEKLSARHGGLGTNACSQEIPFHALEELLDGPGLRLFDTYCFPRREGREPPRDYEFYRRFLEANWGYPDFRAGTQKPAIERIIESDKDLLLRLPTGAGKSIIFHLPALLRASYSGRLSIVITPLRALMHDQVEGLWRQQFIESVDFLSGGRDPWMNREVYQGVLDGRIELLFIAPERFRVPQFTDVLERRRQLDGGLEFIVFDEAHCVSEWGFEFRPDYLHAARYIREQFREFDRPGNPHRLLLTSATVTQRNRVDLETELGLGGPGEYDDLPVHMPHPIQPFIEIASFELDEDSSAPSDEKFEKACEILSSLDLERSAALLFVRRRRDCHRLSEALNQTARVPGSGLAELRALPFHAGLTESLKAEACDLLRERRVNVLVCTNAFGMGMDIPHIHACIHQRPPTFLEDYLQEVGRMGRDLDERIASGHERVTASLLYNPDDIDRNISMLRGTTIHPPALAEFFAHCVNESVSFEGVARSICLVPSKVQVSDTLELDEGQVTSCLFWLERMGVLKVEGRQPPVLDIVLRIRSLERHAEGEGLAFRLARVLLELVHESQSVTAHLAPEKVTAGDEEKARSVFNRLVRGLVRGVLSLVSRPREQGATRDPRPIPAEFAAVKETEELEIRVPVRELLTHSGDITNDDLFAGLFELAKAQAIDLKKSFVVEAPDTPSEDEYFDLLQHALDRLCASTNGEVELLHRSEFAEELKSWCLAAIEAAGPARAEQIDEASPSRRVVQRVEREVYRAIRTSLGVMRRCGFRLEERFSEEGTRLYARSIPVDQAGRVAIVARDAVRQIRRLAEVIAAVEASSRSDTRGKAVKLIPLTHIVEQLGGSVRISELRATMKLLESSGLCSFESNSDEWVSVVTLNQIAPLPPHDPSDASGSAIQRVYAEMLARFDLQVLRAQAMALLIALPVERRKRFIDEYFTCSQAEELTKLLENTVGEVDDTVVQNSSLLRDLLARVRQERFAEEMAELNEEQLKAVQAPFGQNLLVNAGPGSGKTHVLTMRCAHLIHGQGIDPASILVLAFNRTVVYEIRDRIRALFLDLGYSRYARAVDVTTFHSFALRFQSTAERFDEDSVGEAVQAFAQSLRSDPVRAREIGSRYRAILVDEFQDMNEDFFAVVEALMSNCNGGGMVIGDDDQDILTWNRIEWRSKHRQDCALEAVQYFQRLRRDLEPLEVNLTINYRATSELVERTNGMIARAASQIGFSRMKASVGLRADRAGSGIAMLPVKEDAWPGLVAEGVARGEHLAVLSRSNRECRDAYERLIRESQFAGDQIELLGAEDFRLYQLRSSGGLLDLCQLRKDYEFVESYIWEEMLAKFQSRGYADMRASLDFLRVVYELVRQESGRPRVRDIRDFILEMRCSDVERLKAKIGLAEKRARVTIATVHKVKGLEYETVIVLASDENFPFTRGNREGAIPLEVSAAEEARLYYVAMTRARTRLYGGWAVREKAWWKATRRSSSERSVQYSLKGSPEEIFVSLPGFKSSVDEGWQQYIEKSVAVGDPLELRGKQLMHRGRPVGALESDTAAKLASSSAERKLRVANVIRYTCGPSYAEHNGSWWERLHETVQLQGWFYVVLAEDAL